MKKIKVIPGSFLQIYRGLVYCVYDNPEKVNEGLLALPENDPDLIFLMYNDYYKKQNLGLNEEFPPRYLKEVKRQLAILTSRRVDEITAGGEKLISESDDYLTAARKEYTHKIGLEGSLSLEEFLPLYLRALPRLALEHHRELENFLRLHKLPHVQGEFTREYDLTCDKYKCYYFYRDGREISAEARLRCENFTKAVSQKNDEGNYVVETLVSSRDGLTEQELKNRHEELNFIPEDIDALLGRVAGNYEVSIPRAEETPPLACQQPNGLNFEFPGQKIKLFAKDLKEAQNMVYFYRNRLGFELDLKITKTKNQDRGGENPGR